jgi:transcriptional regulator with XRE-family HTH domain
MVVLSDWKVTMNPIERLRDNLVKRFLGIAVELDAPADTAGQWQLDVRRGADSPWIVVEWSPSLGFGVSTPGADAYGTKPDELYPSARAAYGRVIQLIDSGGRTEPPTGVRLAELRQVRKLSQADVAARAGIKQAAIARMEGRDDILLSTLSRVVSAMNGRLSIRVEFPDGTSRDLSDLVTLPTSPPGDGTRVTRQRARASAKPKPPQAMTTDSVRRTSTGAAEIFVEADGMSRRRKRQRKGHN